MTTGTILTAAQIRRQFVEFFEKKHAHRFVASSPVVPHDDPTLLFANAGMNQFKPLFLGQVEPTSPLAGLRRAVNSQKCIRAGGKHNDLEDVGRDTYHHTFFEMLGNWSFGDYFKEEAIAWAWELLTGVWGLDPDRLYATYFEGSKALGIEPDREAYDLWRAYLPAARVLPGNLKDNFWEMGDTGPCGPCSEVHYDFRPDDERAREPGYGLVNADSEGVIEIWNLVFIQHNRTGPESLEPLPERHVDTGMGFERIARVLQGKSSNYDTDVFTPLFGAIREATGARPYDGGPGSLGDEIDTAYRVIADHVRTLAVAITDGAEPSNEGRGYVLRRILRRAVRYARQTLGAEGHVLSRVAPTVVETMGEAFPELRRDPGHVVSVIEGEEEAFVRTLDHGVALFHRGFEELIADELGRAHPEKEVVRADERGERHADLVLRDRATGTEEVIQTRTLGRDHVRTLLGGRSPSLPAETAFRLYDTYGFPIDLTEQMAEERGLAVDVEGFERLMAEARERSRHGAGGAADDHGLALTTKAVDALRHLNIKPTDDAPKYDSKKITARVRAIWNGSDFDEHIVASRTRPTDRFAVILDRTSFYAEAGGQVGDAGRIEVVDEARSSVRAGGDPGSFVVEDARHTAGFVIHVGRAAKGEIRVGDRVELRVDRPRRAATAANHTATHLLNLALRDRLGGHVDQKGSLVTPERLRFDFSHAGPLTDDEVRAVGESVEAGVAEDLAVHAREAALGDARAVNTLRAVFGETYPDPVRVVSIGPTVEDLLAAPDDGRWMARSVEFCGGTHVERTGRIGEFAVVAEEGVSKGVRRIVALTGAPAREAAGRAAGIGSRLAGAESLPDDHLAPEVAEIRGLVDGAEIPLPDKAAFRARLDALQERAKRSSKQAEKAGREHAVEAARALAEAGAGESFVVGEIPAGSDRHALLAAMDAVRSKLEGAAVLLASRDEEAGKVTIVAASTPDLIAAGLKAGDWVRAASQACGGKGGGRPDSAQGGGSDPAKLPDALDAARAFAADALA